MLAVVLGTAESVRVLEAKPHELGVDNDSQHIFSQRQWFSDFVEWVSFDSSFVTAHSSSKLLFPFQITRRFSISKYINFDMHLDIHLCLVKSMHLEN